MATQAGRTRRTGTREGKLEHRCQRFVEVAEELFLEHGFAGTSVNEVVRVAGGSLATLYGEFGTKEALFEAVMNRRAAALFIDMGADKVRSANLKAELLRLATRMQDHMLSERALAFYRLAVHEGPKFPSVRKAVLHNGLKGFLRLLADYLGALAAGGRLQVADAELAAEDFLTLVQGQLRTIAACGDAAHITRRQRDEHAKHAVESFLRIYPGAGAAKQGAAREA
jgi:AcrR family transcriptional regulator